MSSQTFSIISFTLILLISLLSNVAIANSQPVNGQPSPFGFLKRLQGCHKGDKVQGISNVKKYLQHFGYLSYKNQSLANNDNFDNPLESAVKTYQTNYHLNVTGILDPQTVSTMMIPRCGVPDIINGTTRMQSGKNSHHHRSTYFHMVSHYSFFPGSPRWPKYRLTYGFVPVFPSQAIAPVQRAFQAWARKTRFTFSMVQDYRRADLKIAFYRRDHGDRNPFDGPGGTLAHAFAPTDGRFHYDADERWAVGAVQGATDLETVAVHEIGHLLGLGHSSVAAAIMYPSIASGTTKVLHSDDIEGIRVLYNM